MFKNKIVMLTVIIFIGLALIGGTTFAIWKIMYSDPAAADPHAAAEEQVAKETATPLTLAEIEAATVELEEITTTLKNGSFIKLKIALQLEDPAQKETFKKTQYIAGDLLMRLLSDTHADDLKGNKGIGNLAEKVLDEMNKSLTDAKIVKVYVNSIIVQ